MRSFYSDAFRKGFPNIKSWMTLGLLAYSHNSTLCSEAPENVDPITGVSISTKQVFTNWSATHECHPITVYEPTSAQEVCRVLAAAHESGAKIRPVGSALSPNGIAFSNEQLLSTAAIDYINIDAKRRLVTVGGGAVVRDILKALNKHGLTLENFSSIQEQQIAGWTQVAAHGTGSRLPTVDEMIVRMKLATPTEGLLTLVKDSTTGESDLFKFAKVGLGSLGVVTEMTLCCIPKMRLVEQTSVVSTSDIQRGHAQRLDDYRHVRYMWLPRTSKVVVVVANKVDDDEDSINSSSRSSARASPNVKDKTFQSSSRERVLAATFELRRLLLDVNPLIDMTEKDLAGLSFAQLRDLLLDYDPLNCSHIEQVNLAEAAYWLSMGGSREDDSTNILGFDCGGAQLGKS